jgi:hypothetical protein
MPIEMKPLLDYIYAAMPLNPEATGSSIVLLGSFNPAIFQPQWFVRQGLISESDAENAEIKIISPQISHFETERFVVQVVLERFIVASKPNADAAPLRDLVAGTFFILEHTPVIAMGLNRQMHLAMESEANWHRLGDRLAPKDGWKGILKGQPGMLSLSITTPMEQPSGAVLNIKVEPSQRIKFGAYFETNEHYPASKEEPLKDLMKILGDRWEKIPTYASTIVEHILNWTRNEE